MCLGAFVWLRIYFGLPEEGMAGAAAAAAAKHRGLGEDGGAVDVRLHEGGSKFLLLPYAGRGIPLVRSGQGAPELSLAVKTHGSMLLHFTVPLSS